MAGRPAGLRRAGEEGVEVEVDWSATTIGERGGASPLRNQAQSQGEIHRLSRLTPAARRNVRWTPSIWQDAPLRACYAQVERAKPLLAWQGTLLTQAIAAWHSGHVLRQARYRLHINRIHTGRTRCGSL